MRIKQCRNCRHGDTTNRGYGCITCTLDSKIFQYGISCHNWAPYEKHIGAEQFCKRCGQGVLFRDICICGEWGLYYDDSATEHIRWGKDAYICYRELDPEAWNQNDYPPDRGRWDPVFEHNYVALDAGDLVATDWQFWEDPAIEAYREAFKEQIADTKSDMVPTEPLPLQGASNNEDLINNPSHYNHGPIEVIDIIEGFGLSYHLGNVLKYILRAGHKQENTYIQDLKKASWYLNRYLKKIEGENEESYQNVGFGCYQTHDGKWHGLKNDG